MPSFDHSLLLWPHGMKSHRKPSNNNGKVLNYAGDDSKMLFSTCMMSAAKVIHVLMTQGPTDGVPPRMGPQNDDDNSEATPKGIAIGIDGNWEARANPWE